MSADPAARGDAKTDPAVVAAVMQHVSDALARARHRPVVIGICGAQGSGKTTLARALLEACAKEGLRAAALSLDDLYLTHAERQELGRSVHPLLATRGVPGTHDIALGLETFDALESGMPLALPRFDKARDDRVPERDWPVVEAGCEVLIFEGWCVGAFPQPASELAHPVNALEAAEDAGGQWRRYVNDALGDAYQRLFARLDRLVMLAAPGFEVVQRWRLEQEQDLRAKGGSAAGMDAAGIARFIAHYQRLTCWMLAEMPKRADLVIRLDEHRRAVRFGA